MTRQMDYTWHWWINQYNEQLRAAGKPVIGSIYSFKSMLQCLPWLGSQLKQAFTATLPTSDQHCSHCEPEPIKDNVVVCALGCEVTSCPILLSLRDSFHATGRKHYPADEMPDDAIYDLMGQTCAWHLLATDWAGGGFKDLTKEGHPKTYIDWNEGVLQDKGDRRYWERLYENLSSPNEPEPEDGE